MKSFKLRIILDCDHDPAFNMAADRYLLNSCGDSECVTVRLYTWSPPSITIGYSQKARDLLDLNKMSSDGIRWIRRPTGGRAVLHHDDLTYSCIFPKSIKAMGSSISETYEIISRCLLHGLNSLGIPGQRHDSCDELREVRRDVKLPCFLAPNRDEIMVGSKKLVGSAQKRTDCAVLQHGSIPISTAYRMLPRYLQIPLKEQALHTTLLERKSTCIHEIKPDMSSLFLADGLTRSFAEILPGKACVEPWTDSELGKIRLCDLAPKA